MRVFFFYIFEEIITMIVCDLMGVFLLGATIVVPTALVVIIWKVYTGEFD